MAFFELLVSLDYETGCRFQRQRPLSLSGSTVGQFGATDSEIDIRPSQRLPTTRGRVVSGDPRVELITSARQLRAAPTPPTARIRSPSSAASKFESTI
ncbi:unnamed protein product [Lactuca saligna]|uniref:Uncharacterized protein n=1 Tax=Lactuca saligna TaxID=75948 RepID=A0AA35VJC7_LACSI|nr:unnamed protein product [Lactuca saligna]